MLSGQKTYILALVTVVYAVTAVVLGKMDVNQASGLIGPILAAAFVRHGISTSTAQSILATNIAVANTQATPAKPTNP